MILLSNMASLCVCVCVCARAHARVRVRVRVRVRPCVCEWCVRVRASIYMFVRACVRACVCAHTHACVSMSTSGQNLLLQMEARTLSRSELRLSKLEAMRMLLSTGSLAMARSSELSIFPPTPIATRSMFWRRTAMASDHVSRGELERPSVMTIPTFGMLL